MQVSFLGTPSILKTHFLEGNLKLKWGLYGGYLTKNNVSVEHVQPKSRRGRDGLDNLALVPKNANYRRKNKPLCKIVNENQINRYLKQFEGVELPDFNGDLYIQRLRKTIARCFQKNL